MYKSRRSVLRDGSQWPFRIRGKFDKQKEKCSWNTLICHLTSSHSPKWNVLCLRIAASQRPKAKFRSKEKKDLFSWNNHKTIAHTMGRYLTSLGDLKPPQQR